MTTTSPMAACVNCPTGRKTSPSPHKTYDNMGDQLFLKSNDQKASMKVNLHPVVLFSILDHHIRRGEGQKRVIGTLLGRINNGVVEVTNCFPVPHSEKKEVAVGKEFQRQMYNLHRQVNKTEEIVGWYGTTGDGEAFSSHTCLIHDFYGRECSQPVHLVVDTSLRTNTLDIKAFVNSRLTISNRTLAAQFQQIEAKIRSTEAEKIGVDSMLKAMDGANAGTALTVGAMGSEMSNLEQSIETLLAALRSTCSYVDDVVAGKKPMQQETGQMIAEAVAAVPRIKPKQLEEMFDNSVQDLLMVSYLSNLTRTQLAVAEKLSSSAHLP